MKNFKVSTYAQDRDLLKRLGLEVFKDIPVREERYLGTVHIDGDNAVVEVDVYMTGYPAQFYRFDTTVVSKEGDLKASKVTFSTGSGSFSNFWKVMEPMLKLMADGMMTIQTTAA